MDRFVVAPDVEKQLKAGVEHALRVGDSLMFARVVGGATKKRIATFVREFGSATHGLVYGDIVPDFFMFNNPESACRTCGGIGTDKRTHQDLLISNPERSIRHGCFLRDAFTYRPDNHRGYTLYSLSEEYGFSLDAPWQDLPEEAQSGRALRHRRRAVAASHSAGRQGAQGELDSGARSPSRASPAASSGTIAGIGSATCRVPAWRRGSTG